MYGSAFPRALPFSLASAALAGFLASFFPTSTTWDLFKHPYPFQTFAFVAGFMVVFRCEFMTDSATQTFWMPFAPKQLRADCAALWT